MQEKNNSYDGKQNENDWTNTADATTPSELEKKRKSESEREEKSNLVQNTQLSFLLTDRNPSGSDRKSVYKKEGQPHTNQHLVAHQIFIDIKNQRLAGVKNPSLLDRKNSAKKDLLNAIFGLIQIVVDWVLDLVIAGFHFSIGRYYVGSLTLIFVFLGGGLVTFSLHVLMKRKGHKEFMEELKKINATLGYLIYIPSFLPFFSCGLKVYLLTKLNKTPVTQVEELERLDGLLRICEEHRVTDLLYESCFEAYPQAILQTLTLIEKPKFTIFAHYVPLLGVISAWIGISMAPINLSKSLNNKNNTVKWTEMLAGMANKGVTLLSFALFISASRKHFSSADISIVNMDLILSTIFSILGLALFSELPGIVSFHLELGIRRKMTQTAVLQDQDGTRENEWKLVGIRGDWQLFINFVSLLIPLTALVFWIVTETENGAEGTVKKRFVVLCVVFGVGFVIAFLGWMMHNKVPWLGTFSLDILLLFYIGVYSYTHQMDFEHIDFHYDPPPHHKHTNNNTKHSHTQNQQIETQIQNEASAV